MLTLGGDDRGPWPSSFHATAIAVVTAAFTVLGVLVALGAGGGLDGRIYEWVVSRRTPACDAFFVAFTTFGTWYVIAPIALAAGVLFAMARRRRQALLATLAPACAFLLDIVLKMIVRRTPPGDSGDDLVAHARYSFPSGHTMATTAFAVALVFAAWPTRWRWPVTVAAVAAAAAMGFSRVYVGVHWPSDVVGGWMMGAATAWLVWLALRPAR